MATPDRAPPRLIGFAAEAGSVVQPTPGRTEPLCSATPGPQGLPQELASLRLQHQLSPVSDTTTTATLRFSTSPHSHPAQASAPTLPPSDSTIVTAHLEHRFSTSPHTGPHTATSPTPLSCSIPKEPNTLGLSPRNAGLHTRRCSSLAGVSLPASRESRFRPEELPAPRAVQAGPAHRSRSHGSFHTPRTSRYSTPTCGGACSRPPIPNTSCGRRQSRRTSPRSLTHPTQQRSRTVFRHVSDTACSSRHNDSDIMLAVLEPSTRTSCSPWKHRPSPCREELHPW